MKRLLLVATALLAVACGQSDTVATVNGEPIARSTFEALHPNSADLTPDERASSVFLLVLHKLISSNALSEFDVSPEPAAVEAGLIERTGGGDDVDSRLANRGITQERVRLEAELDVIRNSTQTEFIVRGGPGVDIDAAYRRFISLNSIVCVVLLAPEPGASLATVTGLVDRGATLEEVTTAVATEEVDLGCTNPVQHPEPVQPVAVDGEIGIAYLQEFSDGTTYIVGVTERDAPTLEDVMDEVIQIAAESQGRELFDEWAFDLLGTADVEIDSSIGTWESTADSGDVPTVVP